MKQYDWNSIPKEQMSPAFARQVIHSDSMTVARVYLKAGCSVPEHQHPNEQISMILEGAMRFYYQGKTITLRAGDVLQIPANLPHAADAIEDTVAMDLFSPPREDWISGNDSYLRGSK
jgi:quercetin dioxygenase-like cupin family protein